MLTEQKMCHQRALSRLLYYRIRNSIKPRKVDSSRHMQFGKSRSGAICQKIQQYIRMQMDNNSRLSEESNQFISKVEGSSFYEESTF